MMFIPVKFTITGFYRSVRQAIRCLLAVPGNKKMDIRPGRFYLNNLSAIFAAPFLNNIKNIQQI